MKKEEKVLIVGGVAGGATAAARLRRNSEQAEIIMFERGKYISFANCGLPYYIGGKIENVQDLTLETPEHFQTRFCVDVRIWSEVIKIDPDLKKITVKNHQTAQIYEESYDKLILATGAEPIKPAIEGINSKSVFTLRSIPDAYKIKNYITQYKPKSAIIVGGGYIGVEMAENLHQAGLNVTIVEMSDQVIAPLDYDMASDVHRYMRSKCVHLILNKAVQSIRENDNGLCVSLGDDSIKADMLIMAVGVRPESKIAQEAGLLVNQRGAIVVSANMLTSDKDVYAVGDVAEVNDFITNQAMFVPLAGPANKQGRIAADHICGKDSCYTGTQGSAILKVFDMVIASTGINEKTAKRLQLTYDKSFTYSPSHATYYPGAVNMAVKLIFEKKTGKVLGAQIVGFEGVDKRCDILAAAIRFGATVKNLTQLELCYAPPFSSAKDPVNMAGFAAENLLEGTVKHFHWHDVHDLIKSSKAIFLDVRTNIEYKQGHIDGFMNIPLDELRDKMHQLDKTKPVYITCRVGVRGYIAARTLLQNGFDAYNLSGGYRLYNSIFGETATLPNPIGLHPESKLVANETLGL